MYEHTECSLLAAWAGNFGGYGRGGRPKGQEAQSSSRKLNYKKKRF